jgi:hypothetical protein
MNSYELSRVFFNFSFENPERINPNHIALYFFCIEHCNRLGWKDKFGLPTTMAKEAIGIRSYNTYIKTLNELVDFGFIKMIEKSKNQYSSNIIALSKNDKALDNALDKAFIKHASKQSESTQQSIDSIDKQITNKQITNKQLNISFDTFWNLYDKKIEKDKCESKWNKLTNKDREDIINHIPKYKLATPDKQYRKNPETYFNNKTWRDEIINSNSQAKQIIQQPTQINYKDLSL